MRKRGDNMQKFYFSVLLASAYLLSSCAEGRSIPGRLAKKPKGTLKTLKADNGDIIDCVDIYKQPAFDHLLMQNHTLQTTPSRRKYGAQRNNPMLDSLFDISWRKNGGCPEGSIPIVRSFLSDHRIIRKNMSFFDPASYNQGHQKFQQRTGLNEPKFFVFWTANNYNDEGCYDLTCPGWVLTSNQYCPGMTLQSSAYGGRQIELAMDIKRDQSTGNWWLYLSDTPIGYWPPSIYNGGVLTSGADALSWGGEILDSSGSNGFHTMTQMGSGHFPSEGYTKVSYVRNIAYIDQSGNAHALSQNQLYAIAPAPNCYSYQFKQDNSGQLYFFYGGPGCS
ncbi:hypothetical protein Ancab_029669 [Ancistrocladus abbreviatus]